MYSKEKQSYILDIVNNNKFILVDTISEDEINPLTDGAENLLLYDATCYQEGVFYIDEFTEGFWKLVNKDNHYHVFEALNFKANNFNGTQARLYITNTEMTDEGWYEDYLADEGEIKIGDEFNTSPLCSSGIMYLFSSSPNTYKRIYEN